MGKINPDVINNMFIHYSGLMQAGTTDFGEDETSMSIFHSIDTDGNGELSQPEIDKAKPGLIGRIKKELQKFKFNAEEYFGEEYTENLKHIDKSSDKSASEQIVQNNFNKAVSMIYEYAEKHPEDTVIQKYSNKLREIMSNGNIRLVDIPEQGFEGLAFKTKRGKDGIFVENHDSMAHLSVNYLLQTILHELRHTMETDYIDSKAEELEAEQTARELQKKITGKETDNADINDFLDAYEDYAEASPGTYKIPPNTGIAVWYKPLKTEMDENNKFVIKSGLQKDMGNVYIEDHVQFGDKNDNEGNSLPTSAKCIIKDKKGNVIQEYDYGKYNEQTRSFDYMSVREMQISLKNRHSK